MNTFRQYLTEDNPSMVAVAQKHGYKELDKKFDAYHIMGHPHGEQLLIHRDPKISDWYHYQNEAFRVSGKSMANTYKGPWLNGSTPTALNQHLSEYWNQGGQTVAAPPAATLTGQTTRCPVCWGKGHLKFSFGPNANCYKCKGSGQVNESVVLTEGNKQDMLDVAQKYGYVTTTEDQHSFHILQHPNGEKLYFNVGPNEYDSWHHYKSHEDVVKSRKPLATTSDGTAFRGPWTNKYGAEHLEQHLSTYWGQNASISQPGTIGAQSGKTSKCQVCYGKGHLTFSFGPPATCYKCKGAGRVNESILLESEEDMVDVAKNHGYTEIHDKHYSNTFHILQHPKGQVIFTNRNNSHRWHHYEFYTPNMGVSGFGKTLGSVSEGRWDGCTGPDNLDTHLMEYWQGHYDKLEAEPENTGKQTKCPVCWGKGKLRFSFGPDAKCYKCKGSGQINESVLRTHKPGERIRYIGDGPAVGFKTTGRGTRYLQGEHTFTTQQHALDHIYDTSLSNMHIVGVGDTGTVISTHRWRMPGEEPRDNHLIRWDKSPEHCSILGTEDVTEE